MTKNSEPAQIVAGRYELIRSLATGGMAEVFLARDTTLQRQVAIKILAPQYAGDPSFVARFRREAQSAAQLNHPNVVAVYDWGPHDETFYIAMEYVNGETLADVLAREGPLPADYVREVGAEVASTLDFAHRQGTVHRDIKPSNIMITEDGNAKVADFGIARALTGDEHLTEAGKVLGTAKYFSPEQAQGLTVDARSDLYSLGVVLFEITTGKPPFSGTSPVAIAVKHIDEAPPRAANLATVPLHLDNIIDKLLAKDPDDRYQTGDEIRQALQTNPNQVDQTAAMTSARSDAINQGSSGAGLAATAAMPTSVRPDVADPAFVNRGNPTQDERPGRSGALLAVLAVLVLAGIASVLVLAVRSNGGSAPTELVAVPDLIGDPEASATSRLIDLELVPEISFEANEGVEPGIVFAQTPEAETEVEPGSPVQFVVAAALETVAVPDVAGKTSDEAQAELKALGIEVAISESASTDVAAGRVISQSVQPGQEANPGSTINLVISTGNEAVPVPSVTGEAQEEATRRLTEAGFVPRVEFVDVAPDADTIGRVVSQSPAADAEVDRGTEVLIQVGRASDTSTTTTDATTSSTEQTTSTERATTVETPTTTEQTTTVETPTTTEQTTTVETPTTTEQQTTEASVTTGATTQTTEPADSED